VTGGGFSVSTLTASATVTESIPIKDSAGNGIGWHVVVTVFGGDDPSFDVYAVCACVDTTGCGSTLQAGQ
jgi:hypothetical protein